MADGRILGPDEYSVDYKAGTVTLSQPPAGVVSAEFSYLPPAKTPRKEAQWKRELRGRA